MFVIQPIAFSRANSARTIRFTEEMFEQLSKTAQQYHISVNSLVLQCCQFALGHMQHPKTDKQNERSVK